MMRLRHMLKLSPSAHEIRGAEPTTEVTFAPMDAIRDGAGGLDLSITKPLSEVQSGSYNYFTNGDVLLAKVTPCFENGKKALAANLNGQIGYATSEVHVLRPDPGKLWAPFLMYLLASENFRAEGMRSMTGAGGLRRVAESAILNYRLAITDLPTQKRIAAFLDRETARIDQLIAKKERLVEVITAKEIVVRDTFVTKGVSDHEMKPSGVDWFGDVPSHWTVCRFNRLISSKVDYRGRTPEKVDDGVFLVTARNIRNGIIDYERSQEFTTDSDWAALSARGLPEVGDILFTTEAPLGQIAQVDRTDVAFAQRIIKFRAKDSMVSNDFLAQLMMTSQFQRSLQLYSSGSTAAGIKSERMAHLFGLVPPKAEQDQIIESLRAEITRLSILVNPIRASIDRLREYRAALITSAVTGRIDVDSYGKTGTTSATLDRIEKEMQA